MWAAKEANRQSNTTNLFVKMGKKENVGPGDSYEAYEQIWIDPGLN